MRRHPCGHLDCLPRRHPHHCRQHKSPPTTNGGARCHRWPQQHIPLATLCPSRAWGGMSPSTAAQSLVWVDGTLTMFVRGENAFCEQTGLLPASLPGCPISKLRCSQTSRPPLRILPTQFSMAAKSQMAGASSTSRDIWTFSRDARMLSRPSPKNSTAIKRGSGGRLHYSGSANFIAILANSMRMILDGSWKTSRTRRGTWHRGSCIVSRCRQPLPPSHIKHGGELRRVDGTLACYQRGGIAIAKLGPC